MATEITYATFGSPGPDRVGGENWVKDAAIVASEIREGHEYYVQVGHARIGVIPAEGRSRPRLCTDPGLSPINALLTLPGCPVH